MDTASMALEPFNPPPDLPVSAEVAISPSAPRTVAEHRNDSVATALDAAYQNASKVGITAEEATALAEDFPDDAFSRGAGGNDRLIYIEHAYLRQRLNKVLGVGSVVPVRRREWVEDFEYFERGGKKGTAHRVYVDLVLVVRGAVVGEAIGEGVYYPNNASSNYGDALESAKSNAFRRCCKEFGVGLQAWMKGWCAGWEERNPMGGARPRPAAPAAAAPQPAAAPAAAPAPTALDLARDHEANRNAATPAKAEKAVARAEQTGRMDGVNATPDKKETAAAAAKSQAWANKCKQAIIDRANAGMGGQFAWAWWAAFVEMGYILPTEPMEAATTTKLFPTLTEAGVKWTYDAIGEKARQIADGCAEDPAQAEVWKKKFAAAYNKGAAPEADDVPMNFPPQEEAEPAANEQQTEPGPSTDDESWRQFLVPFGKNKGVPLGEVEKNSLYGHWANFKVETTYNGKPRKAEWIESDKLFRAALDAAGAHYEFTLR